MTEHVRIHCPSTRTAQVPHSPFLHLYLMNWPACAATAESGCPTVAIVRSVSLPCVNSTGMEPVSPTALAPRSPAPPAFSASVARRDQSFMRGWLERSAAQGAGRSGETDLSGVTTAAVLVASAKKLVKEVI